VDLGEVPERHGRGEFPQGGALEGMEERQRRVLDGPGEAVRMGAVCQAESLVHEVVVNAKLLEFGLGELIARQTPGVAQGAERARSGGA
jgi:hypothetical protein